MPRKIFFLFLSVLCLTSGSVAAGTGDSTARRRYFVDLTPISRYSYGKAAAVTVGLTRRKHSAFIGLQVHLNPKNDETVLGGFITRDNGYASRLRDFLHIQGGYERHFRINDAVSAYFVADVTLGSMSFATNYLIYIGQDSSGAQLVTRSLSVDQSPWPGSFLQGSIGGGIRLNLGRRLQLGAQLGLGGSCFRYVAFPKGGNPTPDAGADLFVRVAKIGLRCQL